MNPDEREHVVRLFMTDPDASSGFPASERKIHNAENVLGIRFPVSYRDFLATFGAAIYRSLYLYGLSFHHPFRSLIDQTEQYRSIPPEHRHPAEYLIPIADNTGGFFLYLDAAQMDIHGECPVVKLGNDGNLETYARNFYAAVIRYHNHLSKTKYSPIVSSASRPDKSVDETGGPSREFLWLEIGNEPNLQRAPRFARYCAVATGTREVFAHASLFKMDAEDQARVLAAGKGFFADPTDAGSGKELYLSLDHVLAEFPTLPDRNTLINFKKSLLVFYDII